MTYTQSPTPSATPTYITVPPYNTTEPAPPTPTDDAPVGEGEMSDEAVELLEELEGFRAEFYWLFGEKHIG